MALRQADEAGVPGAKIAHDRGLEWLVTKGQSRREEAELLYTFWANIYATAGAGAGTLPGNTVDPRIRQMAEWHVDRLSRYATYLGGWNYYDFTGGTQQPSMGPTSFGSGAG